MDTRMRSWVKSLVWRVIGIALLGGLSYLITGNWQEMTLITVTFHSVRMALYYLHERAWERISWGRQQHPLSELPVKEKPSPEHLRLIEDQLRQLGYID